MAKSKQRSAAQKREQLKQQREQVQNEQVKTRTMHSRRRPTRTNPWPIIGAIVLVVAIVIGIFVYLSNQQTAISNQQAAAAFKTTASIDPQTFGEVGTGKATNMLHALNATPVLKGADGKPEILYVGGEYCPFCAAQRWGMVAALSRFGTLSPLTPIVSSEDSIPTFTFEGYKYSSPYIDFVAKEQAGQSQQPLDKLTSQEQQIVSTYDTTQYLGSGATPGAIPFISFANQYVSAGAYYDPIATLQGKSYQQIEQQLQDPTTDVAQGIVGTANYLTAAICKVTNNQPANVCTANPIPTLQSSLTQAALATSGAPQLALAPGTNAIDVRRRA